MLGVGADGLEGCGECHNGTHHPFSEEWASSRHANTDNHAQEREDCAQCHEARGVFAAWGLDTQYSDEDSPEVIPITCAVCHDPHGSPNSKQLRFPINTPNVDTNLCMKCHHKRSEPDPSSSRGPHSPQGPLLVGEDVGWVPPSFAYPGKISGTHGSEANPRLCAGCHMNRFEVTDPSTGGFLFQATGHGFKGIPCLDAQGIPSGEEDCAIDERSFKACAVSGCHGSEQGARSAVITVWTRFDLLTSTIDAMIAQIPSTEFETGDNFISTGEGAKFNSELAKLSGSAAHNPFLVEALLTASIKQIQIDYGIAAPASVNLNSTLSPTTN
jgi:predicted CXXCH cytochrome family protein